ncbi:hypothetical protein CAPTEDRAFT_215538 [Capitella teleta]|uniref:ubiquitinyl hydrolase 1 n=1 Tax=Capitella teleta TaxID=283909 RepID=R7T4B3_CAPTE|nr:hypothetical protein CAPTEDRAFT_215538 [Capitella teleta]|eukprot:ELT87807.1 hypothetical protein CAPTEDRAFT_215538 [Capitella teleta]
MVDAHVLSIALEGNIDQMQYCDKVKNLVEHLGTKLSLEELSKIWRMQNGESTVVIDNIHSIIAACGVKFSTTQLDQLFKLIQMSWNIADDKMRDKLLSLIGKIGTNSKVTKTTSKVLELLWDLAHLPSLKTSLIEQAISEHLTILNDSYVLKENVKRIYVVKCVDDIREGVWVLPALKQLLQISKNIAKHSFHKAEKSILQELNKNYEIIKLVTNSLTKFHHCAVLHAKESNEALSENTFVDGRYTHQDFVSVHLSFLQFLLQEGILYLHWHRARDLWDALIASPDACHWDKEMCYEWFTKGLADLEPDTQSQLFQKQLLHIDPTKLTVKGFNCFKSFFESVNQSEQKLKKSGNSLSVEKTDLAGLDFLWEICLNASDAEITERAVDLLMDMTYFNLVSRFKRDPIVLHQKFIDECYSRLELAMIPLGGSAVAQALSLASTILSSISVPEAASAPSPSRSANLLNIERLLLIAERYIMSVEEFHTAPRTISPHGASFQGRPLTLHVVCDAHKQEFSVEAHSNEMVRSIRKKVSKEMKSPPDQVQIMYNMKMLNKDQKLLHQLGIEDNSSLSDTPSTPTKQSFDLEQEKMLPGVLMSSGGQVFDMLYQLADLDEPKITIRARNLLKLIPTDPSVQDALDSLGQKPASLRAASPEESSPRLSPRSSPRKYISSSVSSSPSGSLQRHTPQKLLKMLLDATQNGMSSFRVLYNLEILSSKLMPVQRDVGTLQSAKSFCEDFLNAGGLSLVVNVLQKETMPMEMDYETRQGIYAIVLQLLQFLLCGLEPNGERVSHNSVKAAAGMGDANAVRSSQDSPPEAASKAVQMMGVSDFTEMVASFMRVTWAAAAGRLHLASSVQSSRDSSVASSASSSSCTYVARARQSTGSTGSGTSSGSDADSHCLHSGVCIRQTQVSARDSNIAQEALKLLVTCLQLRNSLLAEFYSLPCVSDFIVDVLVGSPQSEIRDMAVKQFFLFSETEVTAPENQQQTPQHFVLQTLLKARLPFWVSSSSTRGASYRLLQQCSQYFDLLCRLIGHLTVGMQKKLLLDIPRMLEDELDWLAAFVPSENTEAQEVDNLVIGGHLRLIKTLVTCEGVDKRSIGKSILQEILHNFLFPASKIIMDASDSNATFMPKCSNEDSRSAAYSLLVELANGCAPNLSEICNELIEMHHQPNPEIAKEWEYLPPVDSRSLAGFVGLKNGGATCYMNSVLQQLFMCPSVPESILRFEDDSLTEDSVLYQTQQIFGHLLESKLQYYVPEVFWKVFKLWGQSVNIREQQDALDFYQALIDQCEEQIKNLGRESPLKKTFQGIYSDQKICEGCPHRYEREEVFFALNVTVKNNTLQDELAQFVKGELLEGDNAYFCEKCGEKRNTIKRMCIKTLPPVLCIQLKRFDYDWESNRALKFDDYFKFPFVLDMEPYTAEGMSSRDALKNDESEMDSESDTPVFRLNSTPKSSSDSDSNLSEIKYGESLSPTAEYTGAAPNKQINYDLVGIVVHSGQANAGHYYSFIKDRRGNYMNNPNRGKWYKFNDTVVDEFEMTESALEAECFGGTYKAKVYDNVSSSSTSYPEDRLRYWNGYLLFYERIDDVRTPVSAKMSKVTRVRPSQELPISLRQNSLQELTELVHKGEKKGIFHGRMPASIQQVVREENLRFMKNRDIYDLDYFQFVRKMACVNGGVPIINKPFNEIISNLLDLLPKDVPDNCKQCAEYFSVLSAYSQMGTKACTHLFFHKAFKRLMQFLLGPIPSSPSDQDVGVRRWSSMQARDFGSLHATLAVLILHCDLTPFRTEDPGDISLRTPTTVTPQKILKMGPDMQHYVFGTEAPHYIREVILALKEVPSNMPSVEDMILYASFCNCPFSLNVIINIMTQCSSAPSNELKTLFQVLLEMLLLEDSLQLKRLQWVIDGHSEDDAETQYEGMLAIIKANHLNDSRRSYQCIKFLVALATKCGLAKDYLMQSSTKWQWAVNWLKKKMTEYYWPSTSTNTVTSNEDSNSHSFQRTISAQDTLAEATAMLTELESTECTDMEISQEPTADSPGTDKFTGSVDFTLDSNEEKDESS